MSGKAPGHHQRIPGPKPEAQPLLARSTATRGGPASACVPLDSHNATGYCHPHATGGETEAQRQSNLPNGMQLGRGRGGCEPGV